MLSVRTTAALIYNRNYRNHHGTAATILLGRVVYVDKGEWINVNELHQQ